MENTTPPVYTIAPAPKFAGMIEFDCALCGHETLARPVFLDGPGGRLAAGTGCAAKLLGIPARRVRNTYDTVQAEADARQAAFAERAERYTTALAAFHSENDTDAALATARTTYHRLGGAAALGLFPGWLARVAATGELD